MRQKKLFLLYLSSYIILRIFSYYFAPGSYLNLFITSLFIVAVSYFLIYKPEVGASLVAAEILLGGSGSFLNLFSISLRTILLGITTVLFCFKYPKEYFSKNFLNVLIYTLIAVGFIGTFNGLLHGNSTKLILSDLIPYLFLLYYFPLKILLKNTSWLEYITPAMWAAVAGSFSFIFFTFAGFSTGRFILQDTYYHWFRDIAGGKITFVEFNFFRLVLNEHLLLAPTFIYCFYQSLKNKKLYFYLGSLLLAILAINLTRVYFLGIIAGMLIILNKTNFLSWFKMSARYLAVFLIVFCSLFLISSGGKTFGLEIFGLRLQSIVMPNIENSSLSRLLLLPEIWKKIVSAPILGSGLGSTVSVYSPVFKQVVTTPHFDWGYLEILAELGIVGLSAWLIFIFFVMYKLKKQRNFLLAVLISLFIINITSPAIFHVFGTTLIVLIITLSTRTSTESDF